MKIGELATLTDTPVETIRFYEREGLLATASRTSSNYRVYEPAHVDQLVFIRHCRSLDMAHDEIRVLLELRETPQESCEAVNQVLDEHIGHVAKRIRELKALQKQLTTLRAKCEQTQDVANCGILNGLSEAVSAGEQIEHQHVPAVHGRKR